METIHRFVGLRRDAKPRAIQHSSIKYRSSANTGVDVSLSRALKEAGTRRCTEAQQRLGEPILTQEDFKEQKKGNPTDDSRHLEAACRKWVQEVVGVVFADGSSLQEELKSGVVLCQLCNAIRPGVCAEPSTMSVPSEEARRAPDMETLACYFTSCDVIGVPKERQLRTATLYQKNNFTHLQNISRYLAACEVLGVPTQHLFQTVALYENSDMMQVLNHLLALGRVAQHEPNYRGPPFGYKV